VSLYVLDYHVPWWVLVVAVAFAVAALGLGLLFWYYRPTFEWVR